MSQFTFKAQAKSNAKRFLLTTCKVDPAALDSYLIQVAGEWGTYLGADGKPVPHETVEGSAGTVVTAALPTDADIKAMGDAGTDTVDSDGHPDGHDSDGGSVAPPPSAGAFGAFGAFAMAQLTAPSNAGTTTPAAAPSARPAREGATPTSGLKIQKDRPMQNGVQRQSAGSVGDKLWALFDAAGNDITLEAAKVAAIAAGLSPTSAAIALYNWRKFHGIASRPINKA